jgi:hypothetical protein
MSGFVHGIQANVFDLLAYNTVSNSIVGLTAAIARNVAAALTQPLCGSLFWR